MRWRFDDFPGLKGQGVWREGGEDAAACAGWEGGGGGGVVSNV